MLDVYRRDRSPIEFKERASMAEMIASTLNKLKALTKEARYWRDDRARLKRNISRLKANLRERDTRGSGEALKTDSSMLRQRAEIERLGTMNNELRKKIIDLKGALTEAEEDIARAVALKLRERIGKMREKFNLEKKRLNNEIHHLRRRLKDSTEGQRANSALSRLRYKLREMAISDRTVEVVFNHVMTRVADTIAKLSEELVNVSEDLCRSNSKNGRLERKMDRMKAMLCVGIGEQSNRRKRIAEFEEIARQLKRETRALLTGAVELDSRDRGSNAPKRMEKVSNVEFLMERLKTKLKSDHDALITAGNPNHLNYVKRMIDLRVNLKYLQVELKKSLDRIDEQPRDTDVPKFARKLTNLEESFEEICVQIDRINVEPINRCKIGASGGFRYFEKIINLKRIIEFSKSSLDELKTQTDGSDVANDRRVSDRLNDLIDELCDRIKELEIMVSYQDNACLIERIGELEKLIIDLKVRISEKNEAVHSLERDLKRKMKELNEARKVNASQVEELNAFKRDSGNRLTELQQAKAELVTVKKKLQEARVDRQKFLDETDKLNEIICTRDREIANIASERNETRKALDALSRENDELKITVDSTNQEMHAQFEFESNEMKSNLDEANRAIIDLKENASQTTQEKEKLRATVARLISDKDDLEHRFNLEKASNEKVQWEYKLLLSTCTVLENKVGCLQNENKEFTMELADSRAENKLLKSCVDNGNDRCSTLQEQMNKIKIERDVLREETNGLKANVYELKFANERSLMQLESADKKIKSLQLDNSILADKLEVPNLKNSEYEAQVQTLTTENNGLATHVNELDKENVLLKDQLNKAKAETEYLSSELNKSKIENDKSKSKVAFLRTATSDMNDTNAILRKAKEELKMKYNEIHSDYRILENQLKLLRESDETRKKNTSVLRRKNNDLRNQLSAAIKQLQALEKERKGSPGATKDSGDKERAEVPIESEICQAINDKVKLKGKAKSSSKKIKMAAEAMRNELADLKTENAELKIELARVKNEFYDRKSDLTVIRSTEDCAVRLADETLAGKEKGNSKIISNIFPNNSQIFPNKMARRANASRDETQNGVVTRDEGTLKDEESISVAEKFKIENAALKTEINTLRDNINVAIADNSMKNSDLRQALGEMNALKMELSESRREKEELRIRIYDASKELDNLNVEKSALKNELLTLRKMNSDLRSTSDILRNANESLKALNIKLEQRLTGALNEVNKFTVSTDSLDEFEVQLKNVLQDYASTKESLRVAYERSDNVKSIKVDRINRNMGEHDLTHIEGQMLVI